MDFSRHDDRSQEEEQYDEQLAEALARLLVAEHLRRETDATTPSEQEPNRPADHAA